MMARLLLMAILVLVVLACLVILVSALTRALQDGGRALATGKGELMAPTTFQKIAYAALAILLLGVSLGWLGGL